MGMISEFREFAVKGNVIDMAVGVVIGVSFGKIVSTLVEKIFMPLIGAMTGRLGDISKLQYTITMPGLDPVDVGYGALLSAILDFIIVAFCLFLVVKGMNSAKRRFEKQQEVHPAAAPPDVKLLTEIRDLLKARV